MSSFSPWIEDETSPFTICSIISSNCSPRKIDIMAGGASLAPSLWSLPGFEAERRRSSALSSTAFITAVRKSRNRLFSCGFLPGSRRLMPVSVIIDQLLCLPEPFTPAKGFSCSRHSKLCLLATFFHNFHNKLVVVCRNIGCSKYRCHFMLCRRNFIMLCFGKDSKFPEFNI